MIPAEYPSWKKFARLTKLEERAGLFASQETIGRRQQWQALLANRNKRQRAGRFLVQGVRPISLAVQYGWPIHALIFDGKRKLSRWAEELLETVRTERIAMDQRLKVSVPIVLKGEAAGVKQQGGILEQVLREVELECLPGDIPSHIDVDVSELVFGKLLRVSDLPHSASLKYLTDPNQTVAHIISVKEEVAPTPEAVAAEATATPTEPEVIKKGKQETEEGEGEAAEAKPEKAEKAEKKEKK